MHVLINLCKILLLLTFAAITFGWGACGALGMAVTLDSSRVEWGIVGLSLGGFALMGLFGWGTWRMLQAFFPKSPKQGKGGSDFPA
ncbi:MAG: hypothetical protein FIA97_15450 [Methylococcaceae bacterium]|nr:hypothetical protein [Methylococcaceae bacterium]